MLIYGCRQALYFGLVELTSGLVPHRVSPGSGFRLVLQVTEGLLYLFIQVLSLLSLFFICFVYCTSCTQLIHVYVWIQFVQRRSFFWYFPGSEAFCIHSYFSQYRLYTVNFQ